MNNVNSNKFVASERELLDRIQQIVETNQRFLVVSHIDPDGDAIGTQLAFGAYLTDLGKTVSLAGDSAIPDKYRYLDNIENIKHASSFPSDWQVDVAVVLECPRRERIGSAVRLMSDAVTVVNVDHHMNGVALGHVNWIDSRSSSVGEMIYEYFVHVGYSISKTVAEYLYTAILTDTGRFRFSSTSPRTMEIAARLLEAGADSKNICDLIYYSMPPSTMLLTGKVLDGIEFHFDNQVCLLTLTNNMLEQAGATADESDGLVDFTMFCKGVRVGVLLKEIDSGVTKASLRSADGIDVAALATVYGGGGHYNAAGCVIPLPLEQARKQFISSLAEVVDGP